MTERQIHIIEAAGKILTRSGINGLTIKNLALEMGFTEGAVYRHFKSKEDMILKMLEFLATNMNERLSELPLKGLQPDQKIQLLFKNQMEFFTKKPYFVVVVFSDGLMEDSQSVNEKVLGIMAVKIRHLLPIVLEGQLKGFFTREISAEDLAQIIMGSFRLQMYRWRSMNFQYDIEDSGMRIIESLLKMIKV